MNGSLAKKIRAIVRRRPVTALGYTSKDKSTRERLGSRFAFTDRIFYSTPGTITLDESCFRRQCQDLKRSIKFSKKQGWKISSKRAPITNPRKVGTRTNATA